MLQTICCTEAILIEKMWIEMCQIEIEEYQYIGSVWHLIWWIPHIKGQ